MAVRHSLRISFQQFLLPLCIFSIVLLSTASATASAWTVERVVEEPVFGAQVYLREAGVANQKILLLVHGIGDRAGSIWDDLLPELAHDYHIIAPDLPGFGRSSKGNHLYSPEAYADFLDWLIKSLPNKPVTLVGHSLGGGIALMYSAHHATELERLVLVDAVGLLHRLAVSQNFVRQQLDIDVPYSSTSIETPLGRVASLLLEKASHLPLNPELLLSLPFMRQKFLAADPTRIAGLALVETDYSLLLAKNLTPTWLIWGAKDEIASLRIARALEWNLPQVKLKILPDSGHTPMLDDLSGFRIALQQALQEEPESRSPLSQITDAKMGRCEGEQGRVFSGHFSLLQINNCSNVLLRDVVTNSLEITDSQVKIETAKLLALPHRPALTLLRSQVVISGADIVAGTGLVLDQSRVDLAGVRFVGAQVAIKGTGNPSSVLCSSSVKMFDGVIEPLHLSRSLIAGEEI